MEPEWIVNSLGELGVKIGSRFFFLYKGENIEYTTIEEGEEPIKFRKVLKREFGEVCIPEKFVAEGFCSVPDSFVDETDGWELLPFPPAGSP